MRLFVLGHELHDGVEVDTQRQPRRESKKIEDPVMRGNCLGTDATNLVRESHREGQSNRHRFAVTQVERFFAHSQRFERVRQGMSVVQHGASITFAFVSRHDGGL